MDRHSPPPARSYLLLLLILLIPFVAIGFYAEPIADDYAYAYRVQLRPYLEAYLHEYFTWNGRYTSNVLVLLNNRLIDHRWLYHLAPGAMILLLGSAIYFVTRGFLRWKNALQCALLVLVLYLGSNARIAEIIYWYTATVTYTLGTVFSLFAIGALIRLAKNRQVIWLFAACIFVILSSGTNEISMVINLLIALIYALKRGMRWPVVLFAAGVAALVVYFAPGNAVRTGLFPNAHNVLYSAGMSVLQSIRFSVLAAGYLAWPIAIALVWRNFDVQKLNFSIRNFVQKTPVFWLAICFFSPLFLAAFLPYYATGLLGQHRTMAFGQFYLICFSMALPFLVFIKFKKVYIFIHRRLNKVPVRIFIMGCITSYLLFGNSQKALYQTINGDLAKQQNQLLHREHQIRNAEEDEVFYFQPLDTTVLFVIDLSSNPNYWINKHQSSVLNSQNRVQTIVGTGK